LPERDFRFWNKKRVGLAGIVLEVAGSATLNDINISNIKISPGCFQAGG
jgi:hypothetical protein